MKPHEGRKRRWGDRYDGYKVRNLDPMGTVIPYIMPQKVDSWVLFEDKIDITETEKFIRKMREEEIPNLTMYHIIFAAIVRVMVEVPELNRFVQNCKVYSRNEIKGAMVIMKGMKRDSERTTITPGFQCEDTLKDVVNRIEAVAGAIDKTVKVKEDKNKNDFDVAEVALSMLPGWLLKLAVKYIRFSDKHGFLPKWLQRVSCFHSSFFLTNMGSIGLDAVYHHVYELGTLSVFGGIGKKEPYYELQADGTTKRGVRIKLQFVVDERSTDGYIYAMGFRKIRQYIMHPEKLLTPPEEIVFDKIDREKKR